jgi:hypothetical protein
MRTTTLFLAALLCLGAGFPTYTRSAFTHWSDSDGDCQDTRQEVLIARAEQVMLTPDECRVTLGSWVDPYSLETVVGDPQQLDVDHIVPLKHAWRHGAAHWTKAQRKAFANDERFLVATHRRLNRQKGAQGPTAWMPPADSVKCWYLQRWIEAKLRYRLHMSVFEAAFIFADSNCGLELEIAKPQ